MGVDGIHLLFTCLLRKGEWASQRENRPNGISACSNLKPISRLLQHRNEAVLFSTCLRWCSVIDAALWSTERSASWYKAMPVSCQQTFIPWQKSPVDNPPPFLLHPQASHTVTLANWPAVASQQQNNDSKLGLKLSDRVPFHFPQEWSWSGVYAATVLLGSAKGWF